MFRASLRPSSGVLKTVTATSGLGNNIGAAAFFQRRLIKFTLKQLRHVSVQSHHHQGAYYLCFLKLQFLK
jgi:hypothetical protein